MKKIILIAILCSLPLTTFTETTCPKGRIECDTPCGRCVDKDDNGICDYIQSITAQKKDIVKKPESSKLKKEITAQKTRNIKPPVKLSKTIKIVKKSPIKKTTRKKPYHLLPLSLSLFFLYFASIILYKKKILKAKNHFKFWNFALLFSFLISGLLGITLVIMINYGIRIKLPFNILFWHTEAGIAMFAISMFHIHWHWRYIKNMFNRVK